MFGVPHNQFGKGSGEDTPSKEITTENESSEWRLCGGANLLETSGCRIRRVDGLGSISAVR